MTRTVLIVEDNTSTRQQIRFALEKDGYAVVEAGSGTAALEAARSARPDLILQDLVLPDADGFALVAALREGDASAVPIVALSGFMSRLDEARLRAAGFDDVVSKPIEGSHLRRIVRGFFPEPVADEERYGAGRRLLLVDHDAVQRKLGSYRFARLGFDVVQAGDGNDALALARAEAPDAIVADVLVPGLDGFELCAALRSEGALASVPIVLMTATYVEAADRALARELGADDYVMRTPELHAVAVALRPLLEARPPTAALRSAADPGLRYERARRATRQLEKQVVLHAGLTQRHAMLSVEHAILSAVAGALAAGRDVEVALDTAMRACFDAGGISGGILFTYGPTASTTRFVGIEPARAEDVRDEMERAGVELRERASGVAPFRVATATLGAELAELLRGDRLFAPIVHEDTVLGGVLLGVDRDLDEDRIAFAAAVAGQLALALALARSFDHLAETSRVEGARVRLLRAVLDAIGDPIVVIDKRYGVSHWNRAAVETVALAPTSPDPAAWPREQGIYHTDQTTLLPWDRLPAVRALRGEAVDREEMFHRPTAEPEGRWMSAHARPVRAEGDDVDAAVVIYRDVTAEKQAQARQLESDRLASIGLVAAGIAHEINNPLTALIAELDMALEDAHAGVSGGDLGEGLRFAREAAERVRVIVRDVTVFARGDSDVPAPVDPTRALESSIRMASPEIRERAIVLRDLEPLPTVDASESRLGQIFLNLIINAAQSLAPRPGRTNEIRVRTRTRADGFASIEIEDTGCGMSAEVKARLFTPFFTTKRATGTGLGLSITQRLVVAIGGRVEVESVPGEGTTFRVLLPPSREVTRRASSSRAPAPLTRAARVLVVDADPMVRQTVARALARHHEVRAESSAESALAHLRTGAAYDVLLLDPVMPTMSGIEFHAHVSAIDPALAERIVFVTGAIMSAEVRSFLDRGTNVRLEKPFDGGQLRAIVEQRIG
ncbi:MAG: response regulator [Myxococcota bacterium]|nr:response regulator [Myxococcota bacterium]